MSYEIAKNKPNNVVIVSATKQPKRSGARRSQSLTDKALIGRGNALMIALWFQGFLTMAENHKSLAQWQRPSII
ncbi:MAG: hypothetical protein LBG80_12085, partial [Bacteroidales bacterium]|nr:hypothetical protein [Bacteroidales bacterium]